VRTTNPESVAGLPSYTPPFSIDRRDAEAQSFTLLSINDTAIQMGRGSDLGRKPLVFATGVALKKSILRASAVNQTFSAWADIAPTSRPAIATSLALLAMTVFDTRVAVPIRVIASVGCAVRTNLTDAVSFRPQTTPETQDGWVDK